MPLKFPETFTMKLPALTDAEAKSPGHCRNSFLSRDMKHKRDYFNHPSFMLISRNITDSVIYRLQLKTVISNI